MGTGVNWTQLDSTGLNWIQLDLTGFTTCTAVPHHGQHLLLHALAHGVHGDELLADGVALLLLFAAEVGEMRWVREE